MNAVDAHYMSLRRKVAVGERYAVGEYHCQNEQRYTVAKTYTGIMANSRNIFRDDDDIAAVEGLALVFASVGVASASSQ